MAQLIKRGILQSFDNTTYTATVLLLEATSMVLASVPCSTSLDGTSAQSRCDVCSAFFRRAQPPGRRCAGGLSKW